MIRSNFATNKYLEIRWSLAVSTGDVTQLCDVGMAAWLIVVYHVALSHVVSPLKSSNVVPG